ncbi:MAG: ABC transporter permease [Chloroflexota bacterium]|nr:MAG: ABC transporter permease [Chloroflexota bacterium]
MGARLYVIARSASLGRARTAHSAPMSLARRVFAARLLTIVGLLVTWEAYASAAPANALFVSSPRRVATALVGMIASGQLWPHVAATASEASLGLALACAVGIPLGIVMGRSAFVRLTIEPIVMAKYASPTVAFLPLIILWLGIGISSKIALVFLGTVVVLIINSEAAVAGVDRRLVEAARAFTASEWQVNTKVILPAALPVILAGLRLAIGRALIMVVVAEMYASTVGLGYLIFHGAAAFDSTLVFVGVIVLAGAGVASNAILRSIERRLAPWREANAE